MSLSDGSVADILTAALNNVDVTDDIVETFGFNTDDLPKVKKADSFSLEFKNTPDTLMSMSLFVYPVGKGSSSNQATISDVSIVIQSLDEPIQVSTSHMLILIVIFIIILSLQCNTTTTHVVVQMLFFLDGLIRTVIRSFVNVYSSYSYEDLLQRGSL